MKEKDLRNVPNKIVKDTYIIERKFRLNFVENGEKVAVGNPYFVIQKTNGLPIVFDAKYLKEVIALFDNVEKMVIDVPFRTTIMQIEVKETKGFDNSLLYKSYLIKTIRNRNRGTTLRLEIIKELAEILKRFL